MLPSPDEVAPLLVVGQVPAKDVGRAGWWLPRNAKKRHMRFFGTSSTFVMIARRTRCYHVRPSVQAALVSREYVIYRKAALTASAILASKIVSAEHFAAREPDVRPRPVHLKLQTNHGGAGDQLSNCVDVAAAVGHHRRFAPDNQDDCTASCADVYRLKVRIQD